MTLKAYIRNLLKGNKVFYFHVGRVYRLISYPWKPLTIKSSNKIIDNFLNKKGYFTFVSIGANDGKIYDPIYKHVIKNNCKGVYIEPVSYIFEKLKSNLKEIENVFFENIAISNSNGTLPFYQIKQSNDTSLPNWYNYISSFNLETILSHEPFISNLRELIEEKVVETRTVEYIIDSYNLGTLNILQIDTEGYDFEILKSINFDKIKPDILLFEHKHLDDEDYKKCLKLLKPYYRNIRMVLNEDTICYH